jgi:hypothetical protein
MMVAYKDATTGQFSAAIPVIWERPAGFSREIANLLNDYGDLTQRVFKVTRNGAAGNMQTTYSISYIPLFDKPESVTADFSAFNNFNIAKHSFWEKTVGDINVFLNTGSFPEVRAPQAPMPTEADMPAYTKPVQTYIPPVAPAAPQAPVAEAFTAPAQPTYQAPVQPQAPAYVPPVTPAPAPETAQPAPQHTTMEAPQTTGSEFGRAPRTFGGLSF